MASYSELNESINMQLANGLETKHIDEDINKLALMEAPIRAANVRKDRGRSRAMSRASTRNKLRKSANQPANRNRMRLGYERWLKSKGSKELSKTATKRFESIQYELEDVRHALSNKLVNVTNIFNGFTDIVQLEDCMSDLEKAEFLFNNFNEEFNRRFMEELDNAGVIIDPLEEDTTTADLPQADLPLGDYSPLYKRKRPKDAAKQLFPIIIREVKALLFDLLEGNEDDAAFQDELVELIQAVEDCEDNPSDDKQKDLENLQDFLYSLVQDGFTQSELDAIQEAANLSLKRSYEDLVINLVREGKTLSKRHLTTIQAILRS